MFGALCFIIEKELQHSHCLLVLHLIYTVIKIIRKHCVVSIRIYFQFRGFLLVAYLKFLKKVHFLVNFSLCVGTYGNAKKTVH